MTKWNENIFDKAKSIFNSYLEGFQKDPDSNLNKRDDDSLEKSTAENDIFQYNKCKICDNKIFINKFQWECKLLGKNQHEVHIGFINPMFKYIFQGHLKGSKHKKRKEKLNRLKKLEELKNKVSDLANNIDKC